MGETDSSMGQDGAIRAFKCNKVDVMDKCPDKKAPE
jgi:hypothetical protein